ncbi:MAG: NAD(P)H-binding protein [Pacificimonas sp.]|jgi:nucleoside-diphosphate-sugar epimerase|nr:NAD(P)H-binding protein [Pacificimonas sp.]
MTIVETGLTLAITGGTGFVGGHTINAALAAGHSVRALTRRDQPARGDVTWVHGSLFDPSSLERLAEGADAVIHIAGVVNANDRAGFDAGNVAGTEAMLAAAEARGVSRFIHVSSLSAREPLLSLYGASKARADDRVRASALDWTIVRPPAVYGPGDTEMLDLYRLARRGFAVAPGKGRFSLIYVTDLARALLALAATELGKHQTFEIADADGPQTHGTMAALIGGALGTRPTVVPVPPAALKVGAALDLVRGKVTGTLPKLSFDRARYIAHPDWTADAQPLRDLGIWQPGMPAAKGVAATADWYRDQGLL